MNVRLDIVRREVARGSPARAVRAGACVCAAPIIATVHIVWSFTTPSELVACDEARGHEWHVSAIIALGARLRILLAFTLVRLAAFAFRRVVGPLASLARLAFACLREAGRRALQLWPWPGLICSVATRVAALPSGSWVSCCHASSLPGWVQPGRSLPRLAGIASRTCRAMMVLAATACFAGLPARLATLACWLPCHASPPNTAELEGLL